jgi:hypothetical protein
MEDIPMKLRKRLYKGKDSLFKNEYLQIGFISISSRF